MPHPEQEHALMIEVARLQKRVDDGDATARILVKDVRAWSDTCDKLRNERDALRAENGRLREALQAVADECAAQDDNFARCDQTTHQIARAALAASADGEEKL